MKRLFNRLNLSIAVLTAGLIGLCYWGIHSVSEQFDRAVRHDLAAAATLARIQIQAERMRRYEKEMFIYIGDNEKRRKYVSEHDSAFSAILYDLDTALMSSNRGFTSAERAEILNWKEAAIFYASEFQRLSHEAQTTVTPETSKLDAARMTLQYNEAIKTGKDRLGILFTGATELRLAKEKRAQAVSRDIGATFDHLFWLLAGLSGVGTLAIARLMATQRPKGVPLPPRRVPPFAAAMR